MGITYTAIVENSWSEVTWSVVAVFELQKSRIATYFHKLDAVVLPNAALCASDDVTQHLVEMGNGATLVLPAALLVAAFRATPSDCWTEVLTLGMIEWLERVMPMFAHRHRELGQSELYSFRVLLVPS